MAAAVMALLKSELPEAEFSLFNRSDFELLAAHGFCTAHAFIRATKEDLDAAIPGRRALVGSLLHAFTYGTVLSKMFKAFHLSKLVRLTPEGTLESPGDVQKESIAGCILKLNIPSRFKPNDVPPNLRLYVRKDCEELYHQLLKELEQYKNGMSDTAKNELRLVDIYAEEGEEIVVLERAFWELYLGNPGTGKSLTGLVILFLFVVAQHTVVYYMEKLATQGQLHSIEDFVGANEYLVDSSTIYIHDGSKIEGTGFIKAATLLITSLDQKVDKDFTKVSGGYSAFYGRLWSMEELEACWRAVYFFLDWELVKRNVYKVGYIPRLVFLDSTKFDTAFKAVKSQIVSVGNLVSLLTLLGPHDISSTFSHKPVHLDRGADSSDGYTKLASDFVKEQLLLRLEVQHWSDAVIKYKSLQSVTALADFRGSVMELLMHLTFPQFLTSCERICDGKHDGKHEIVRMLEVDDAEDLRVFFYYGFDDLKKKIEKCIQQGYKSAYFWPRMKTEAAIDSLYINFGTGLAYFLQSTLAKKHVVVWHPVKKLMDFLKTRKVSVAGLYFVTAPTNYPKFSYQSWKKTPPVHVEYPDLQTMPQLCQFKVMFEMVDKDMENVTKLDEFARGIDGNLKLIMKDTGEMPEEHVQPRRRQRGQNETLVGSNLQLKFH